MHPLYLVCLSVRILIIFLIYKFNKNIVFKNIAIAMLLIMGLGFFYKGITGSNKETQIAKVFWHDARFIHGVFYVLASYYLYNNNIILNNALLGADVCFSIIYRLLSNK
jgi:hypothetical protein